MRKLSAIFLISIIGFSQYARQLGYLECKFSNTFKLSPAKCDCEQIAGLNKQDSIPSPLSKTHIHTHTDEFFPSVREVAIISFFKLLSSKPGHLPGDDECEGNYTKPWQPPNA